MSKKKRWIIRVIFILYMLYLYVTVYSKNQFYSFLLLNTFLGYLPIEIALSLKDKQPLIIFLPLLLLWLLFYPNASYVLTDLFHLARFNPYDAKTGLMMFDLQLWLQFTNLVFSALFCSLLGTWSLNHVCETCLIRFKLPKKFFKIPLIIGFSFLSGVGIYIGRFLRLHTAYLFINPTWTLSQLTNIFNQQTLIFVLYMTILQVLLWLCLTFYRQN